jgi:hypothetical protein
MTLEQGDLRLLDTELANPDVAVSIDTESFPPEVLSIRGKTDITEIDGVAAECAEAAHRFLGAEQARAYLAAVAQRRGVALPPMQVVARAWRSR